MIAAYATPPPVLCGLADQLWALHSNVYDYAATRPNAAERQVQRYETVFKSTVYETEHPAVQVHPLTGERAIMCHIEVLLLPCRTWWRARST